MKKIFKQFDKVGLVVLLLTAMTVLGIKAAERMQTTKWYKVTVTDPNNPNNASNQRIDGLLDGTPTFPCEEPAGIMCAIQLNVDDLLSLSFPLTVQDVLDLIADDEEISIEESTYIKVED